MFSRIIWSLDQTIHLVNNTKYDVQTEPNIAHKGPQQQPRALRVAVYSASYYILRTNLT